MANRLNSWNRVALAIATTLFTSHALAQLSVIQQPGTVLGSFTGYADSLGAGYTTVYTVPAGKYARLTDVIATSRSSSTLCYFNIQSNSALHTVEIIVPPQSTIHLPFNNGPAFAPGEAIVMSRSNRIAAQCDEYLIFTVRGYLFTVP